MILICPLARPQDVRRLDVAMDQASVGRVLEPVRDALDHRDRLGQAQRAPTLDVVVKIAAGDILEHQVVPPRVDPSIVDRHDVRVLERLGAAGLSQESLKQVSSSWPASASGP